MCLAGKCANMCIPMLCRMQLCVLWQMGSKDACLKVSDSGQGHVCLEPI